MVQGSAITYNGGLIGSRTWSIESRHFCDLEWDP